MKKTVMALACGLVISGLSTIALADDHGVKSEKQAQSIVAFRQSILKLVYSNMGPLGAMAKGQIDFDAAKMETNAKRIAQLGMMMEDYFAPDTSGFDVDTEALDAIWENSADFNQKAMDMVEAAQALEKVAASKDEDNYRKAIGAVGGTCKACHDAYKAD
ncbi:c-type cytochrome [Glaciecola sp. 1036]|uniref:c-type cytochrome n=1 Tax=Alteromonadaceae TaxID=72275 RepID=UPI003D01E703